MKRMPNMETKKMRRKNASFGEFLQEKRKENELTLRALAEKLGWSAPYLTDIEKGRRNPPDLEKLNMLSDIFHLSEEEKMEMMELAGKKRESIAPDLPEYIIERDYVAAALRTARDLNAGRDEWEEFVRELKQRKGEF